MDVNEAVKLVTHYIHDKTGKKADINAVKIMFDERQKQMLKQAVKVAVKYYKEKGL